MNDNPTLQDIFEARKLLKSYLLPTPLHHYPSLSKMLGAEVYVKHENHTPIGSFKVRGGLNTVAKLSDEQREKGIIVTSTGNFGQSAAYAGRLFGVKTIVTMPEEHNPGKAEAIRNFGAEIIPHGSDVDYAREYAETLAAERGYYYFDDGQDRDYTAGLGTCMLEILEDLPGTDVVIIPVGGGGLSSSSCIAGKGIKPDLTIIGVSAENAASPYLSWKEEKLVESPMKTFAEGLAVRISFEITQRVLREMLDDYLLVSEDEIRRAAVLMLDKTHNLAEGAGAAALAGALKIRERIKGKKTVLIQSGGNISMAELKESLAQAGGRA